MTVWATNPGQVQAAASRRWDSTTIERAVTTVGARSSKARVQGATGLKGGENAMKRSVLKTTTSTALASGLLLTVVSTTAMADPPKNACNYNVYNCGYSDHKTCPGKPKDYDYISVFSYNGNDSVKIFAYYENVDIPRGYHAKAKCGHHNCDVKLFVSGNYMSVTDKGDQSYYDNTCRDYYVTFSCGRNGTEWVAGNKCNGFGWASYHEKKP